MTSKELRQNFLEFFKKKGHTIIPSASLIPENDSTVLFTTAGMHPLVPYLLGEPHPGGVRLADAQKCLRTDDIDEVGDATHLTFFEMLGNWSLGDYFKKESIAWSYEFLTGAVWLNLDPKKLAISVFAGDGATLRDDESAELWLGLGISKERIAYLGKDDNWWPAGGKSSGPQGPDTEIFYWTGDDLSPEVFDPTDKRWVEVWNNVFMQFKKNEDGSLVGLAQKNVDTGLGLERTAAILQNKKTIFETDLFMPIIQKIEELCGKKYESSNEVSREMRIIADHIRAATFILGDDFGISPSNKDQGYIARRLLRRAVVAGAKLGINGLFLKNLSDIVVREYSEIYFELKKNQAKINDEITLEEEKFQKTLRAGLKKLEELISSAVGQIKGEDLFDLYTTHGFPFELIKELVAERTAATLNIDEDGFWKRFKEHQEISRVGSTEKFKGGLADHSEQVVMGHTATHLLAVALRKVLGNHIEQKGSNITEERLRFDFSHPQKVTPDELKQVEDIVNEQIKKGLPVNFDIMSAEEAKKMGAIGVFSEKYLELGGKIKVYTIGNDEKGIFSREICGGPHVGNTAKIKKFEILKEEAVSAGIRRIKAKIG